MQVMTILRALPFIAVLQAGMMALPAQAADEIRVGFPEVFSETGQRRERFDAAIARERFARGAGGCAGFLF
jgi:hypothetical protein